ncbi:RNB domain-containing ribonuclease [soil metagenome]
MPIRKLILPSDGAELRAGFAAVRDALDVPESFDPAALAEARTAAQRPATVGDRRDLRDIAFVTIDPPGSTDLDQAVELERRGTGYRVRYAIADVASFVVPNGPLDAATHVRGTTVYCPDTRVPLHPVELSEGAASLLPGRDRPAIVWTIDLDADGAVDRVEVERALVRSRAQLDYPGVQRELDASPSSSGADGLPQLLARIGTLRAEQEHARGGLSLGRPEQEVVPDGGGWRLAFRAPLPVEDHNAQISLLTGMAAARIMLDGGIGILRTMPAADEDALRRLRHQARALGVDWPAGATYGDVLAHLDRSQPRAAAFLAAATSLFRGAAWTPFVGAPPEQPSHGAVGAPYAHVTAPLRRLVDRYGLEIAVALHAGLDVPDWVRSALPALGDDMASAAHRAAAVDRACTDLVEATVLAHHVGEVFDGVALDRNTVQLQEPAVVADCDGADLPEGEPVRVRLEVADPTTRTVRFVLAG